MLVNRTFSEMLTSIDKQMESVFTLMSSEMNKVFGGSLFKEQFREWVEIENGYELRIEVPGFTKEELKIDIDSELESVMVEGTKKDQKDRYVSQSTFKYSYILPSNAKTETLKASVQNGVCLLSVLAEKKENKPRTITVTIT